MNEDTLKGEGRDVGGKLKETAGDVTGKGDWQLEGLGDQLGGKAQKAYGVARDTVSDNAPALLDGVERFARENPFAFAAIAGAAGFLLAGLFRRGN